MEQISVMVTPVKPENRSSMPLKEEKIRLENFALPDKEIKISIRTSKPGRSKELRLTMNEAFMLLNCIEKYIKEDRGNDLIHSWGNKCSGIVYKTISE